MTQGHYDETRATARLPNLDVEILHRVDPEREEEQLSITLRAVPSVEAFSRFLEASNLVLFWSRLMRMTWSPWLDYWADAAPDRLPET